MQTENPTGRAAAPAPRQTLGFLRHLFEERGLEPKSKLGQNFLIDLNLLDVLLRAAELSPTDLVLEVGTGTGSLTARLADQVAAVLTVEIDPGFYSLAGELLSRRRNVRQLQGDILRRKHELNPAVLSTLAEMRAQPGLENLKLVANLPYAVATPLLTNFLLSDVVFERMVVMVQLEIAERLTADPGSKAYGALAILVQSVAEVELVRRLPPAAFWPRPQVASAIVRIRPSAARRAEVGDVVRFRDFVRELYQHRRKNLRGSLTSIVGRGSKAEVDRKLAELGLDGTIRAETLDRHQHLRLCAAFR